VLTRRLLIRYVKTIWAMARSNFFKVGFRTAPAFYGASTRNAHDVSPFLDGCWGSHE
jgi:hypothetical protein